jgi:nitrate reductase NapAB chaperone NapD
MMGAMNISGIVIGIVPDQRDTCLDAVAALPGVDVHFVEGDRAVVTQEAGSTAEQEEGLRRIQALPGVAHAELVYHWFGEDIE